MKLRFNVEYQTTFGEQLVLNIKENNAKTTAYRMSSLDGCHWFYELNGRISVGEIIDYYYSVDCDGQMTRHEWLVDASISPKIVIFIVLLLRIVWPGIRW